MSPAPRVRTEFGMSAPAQGSNNRKPIAAPRGDIVKQYTARTVVGNNGEADFTAPRRITPHGVDDFVRDTRPRERAHRFS
jgi:hypothetical protein